MGIKTHFLTMLQRNVEGAEVTVCTTLCGKSAPQSSPDGLNGESDQTLVTCKLCQQHMGNDKSWRWNRYLKYGVK